MPDSQTHRPAVSIKSSPSVHFQKQLASAADHEQQLARFSKANNEAEAQRKRGQLCGVLSDMLINDSVSSLENDIPGRLWRHCFYASIGLFRGRISREKKKRGPNLPSLEKQFKKFLSEGVLLYDYLVKQFHAKLMPPSSQESSQGSAQDSQLSELHSPFDGVVCCLYKLYINLGDLHRYAEAYDKADYYYGYASRLAPGLGNSYNQLAVVAQTKDVGMSCVALYWYARSMLASHETFQTSGNNVERLFAANRTYLKEHARNPKPPILPTISKKMTNDLVKAQKKQASKGCLAHYVDMHYELLNNNKTDTITAAALGEKVEALMRSLQSLLNASSFGDALLCKMVAIAVFSVELNRENNNQFNRSLSEDLVFALGTALGERLVVELTKAVEKAEKVPQTIRLLFPVILTCEYVTELEYDCTRTEAISFWKQCASVGNVLLQLSQKFDLPVENEDETALSRISFKDYNALRGFKPFPFIDADYLNQDPYVAPSEATEILQLNQSQTQQSNSGGVDETTSKLLHMFHIFQNCADDPSMPLWRKGDTFEYNENSKPTKDKISTSSDAVEKDSSLIQHPESAENDVDMVKPEVDSFSAPTVGDPPGRDAAQGPGDVLMYNAPRSGHGPELLVPSALLAGSPTLALGGKPAAKLPTNLNSNVPSSIQLSKEFANHSPVDLSQSPALQPPPGMTPPPGFASPTAPADVATPLQTSFPSQSASSTVLPSIHGQHPYLSQHSTPVAIPTGIAIGAQAQSSMPFATQHHEVVNNSLDWFGGNQALETRNPFAKVSTNLPAPHSQSLSYEVDSHAMDGAALLGSGILESLFATDAPGNQTKNPFAASK